MSFATYRSIGPFDEETLPGALLREHRLKAGTWGLVTIQSGEIRLIWDDGVGAAELLVAGQKLRIPPERPHHLELLGKCLLSIDFQHEDEGRNA